MQVVAQRIPLERLMIYRGMGRSFRYGLNFYLRREVPDWAPNEAQDVYLLSGAFTCEGLKKQGLECEEVPLGGLYSGWFVSHIKPKSSADRAQAGGQSQ